MTTRPARLFTLRLWQAAHTDDPAVLEWRGKVQALPGGEAHYFRGWSGLIERLETLLTSAMITPPFNTQEITMSVESTQAIIVKTGAVHHVALTVSDVRRSQQFYTGLLGFNFLTDFGPKALLHNGSVLLALNPPPDPAQAIAGDSFDESRIGLDHLSLSVTSVADLEAAAGLFDAQGVAHGEIKPLAPFGIAVLAFRDPDNIQVELTAPLG